VYCILASIYTCFVLHRRVRGSTSSAGAAIGQPWNRVTVGSTVVWYMSVQADAPSQTASNRMSFTWATYPTVLGDAGCIEPDYINSYDISSGIQATCLDTAGRKRIRSERKPDGGESSLSAGRPSLTLFVFGDISRMAGSRRIPVDPVGFGHCSFCVI